MDAECLAGVAHVEYGHQGEGRAVEDAPNVLAQSFLAGVIRLR